MVTKRGIEVIPKRPDSIEAGLCSTCIHAVDNGCDTQRPCGQVLACRSQSRALVFGRYPSGRVRQSPLVRHKRDKNMLKPEAWKMTKERLREIGDEIDCVWVGFLSDSQQVSIRRFLRKGTMEAVHLDGVMVRGKPALFLRRSDLDDRFSSWEAYYE